MAGQVVENVRRARWAVEPNGSFATEIAIGSFVDSRMTEDSLKLELMNPLETPGILQQHPDGYPSKVFMPKSAKAGFACNLAGQNRSVTGANSTTPNDSIPLIVVFGAESRGAGTTINDASATTTAFTVASASGLSQGGAIALATGTGGAMECREIKTIAGSVVTLKLALTSAPANGSQVYGCWTYYLAAIDGGTAVSMQLACEGQDDNDRWLLKGGQIASAPKLDVAPGTIPKLTWDFLFADWKYADGVNTTMNLTSAALSDQNLSDSGIVSVLDSEFRIAPHSSSALANTLIHAPQITITPQLQYGPHKTPAGTQTIKQFVRLRNAPACVGEFVVPFEDQTWFTARDAETPYGLFYQIGTGSKGGTMISIPHIVVDDVQREGVDGIAGQRVKWYCRLDNQTTANSTTLQKSAIRIHVF